MHVVDRPSKYSKEYLRKLFQYSLGEDIANSVSHIVGSFFGLYALISLSWTAGRYGDSVDTIAFVVYGISILFLFLMSALYHSMINHTARTVFKRMDHIAIYIMITGSYTPYVFSLLKTQRAYILYAILIVLTIIGIIFKSFFAGKYKKLSTLIYVFMGWASVYLMPQIWAVIPKLGSVFMIMGGVTYTVGALLYAFGKFKYSHMIWHIFVILAGVFMFISINFFILQYRV